MHSTSTALPSRTLLGPVGWLGRSVLAVTGYVGGVTLLAMGAAGLGPLASAGRDDEAAAPGFLKTLMHQLFWMLFMGIPLVGMVHIAIGLVPVASGLLRQHVRRRHRRGRRRGIAAQPGGADDRDHLRGHPGRADDSGAAHPGAAPVVARDDRRPAWSRTRGAVAGDIDDDGRGARCRSRRAAWPPLGSPRPRSPASCSRNGGSRSARWSAGKRRSR